MRLDFLICEAHHTPRHQGRWKKIAFDFIYDVSYWGVALTAAPSRFPNRNRDASFINSAIVDADTRPTHTNTRVAAALVTRKSY